MKKIVSLLLACIMIFAGSISVFAIDKTSAIQMLGALGIMQGDENGELHLEREITRCEFVKMMVTASKYKDNISPDGTGYSLYKDVKSNHWASQYIKLATEKGWVNGYTDGSFRPGNTITIEEACTALLRLLGYSSSDLAGSFPYAQLNKASELGLRKNISLQRGEKLTRNDALFMFCNLFEAETAQGVIYGQSLGYTMTNGEIDYSSVILENLSGPYVAEEGETLSFTPQSVYKNGEKVSNTTAPDAYDVFYYNESLKSLWIYNTRVSGRVTALSPSISAPSSINLGTSSYSLSTALAKYQAGVLGGGGVGKTVTLLLGMNDEVVSIISGNTLQTSYYGVVTSCLQDVSSDNDAKLETTLSVFCCDGKERSFRLQTSSSYKAGKLVSVSVSKNTTNVKILNELSLSGKVSADASSFGDYKFADMVNIIDTNDAGDGVKIEKERLAGCSIPEAYVRYYTLDAQGRINNLILKDATGDLWTYGIMISVIDNNALAAASSGTDMSYVYVLNGKTQSYNSQGTCFYLEAGGFGLRYANDGSIKAMKQLEEIEIKTLSSFSAGGKLKDSDTSVITTYSVAPDVQVYYKKNDTYYSVSLSQINDADYKLTGYRDKSRSKAAGLIRVIVAE